MTEPAGGKGNADPDEALERALGRLLQAGVLAAAAVVAAGGASLVAGGWARITSYRVFHGAGTALRSVGGVLASAAALRADGIVQAGLLILIATPVLRVAFSLLGFARTRDMLYVVLTLIVLCILAAGLAGWNP